MIYKYHVQSVERQGNVAILTATPTNKSLRFRPGQYASVGFMNGWRPSPMRCFSIIGSENNGTVRFAFRVGGNFTRALARLQTADTLLIRGAFGSFYPDTTDQRVVMLASGIGITPFLSMLQRPPAIPITLLYSNRSAKNIPFYDELTTRAQSNRNVQLGFFASEDVEQSSNVIQGRITERYIEKMTTGTYAGSTYLICGAGSFTAQMQAMLIAQGVSPDRIVCESFTQKTKVVADEYQSIRRTAYGLSAAVLATLIIGISVLDLSRAVPKLASVQTKSTQTTNGSSQPAQSNSSETGSITTSTSPSSSSTTSGQNASNNNTATNTPTQTRNYYQPPVSSVS